MVLVIGTVNVTIVGLGAQPDVQVAILVVKPNGHSGCPVGGPPVAGTIVVLDLAGSTGVVVLVMVNVAVYGMVVNPVGQMST